MMMLIRPNDLSITVLTGVGKIQEVQDLGGWPCGSGG